MEARTEAMNQTIQVSRIILRTIKDIPRVAWVSLVLLVLLLFVTSSNTFWKWMYPIPYYDEITNGAQQMQVDPLLVAAIIRTESKFDENDVSHAGAIGLMQLMPNTAIWIARESGYDAYHPEQLSQRTVNIRLGSWYIAYLMKVFHGNRYAAIAAYNSGPNRVKEWLSMGRWDGTLERVDQIPVGETRHFVQRVNFNYETYLKIYGNNKKT
jgi:soluble lytic murein transglycosylase